MAYAIGGVIGHEIGHGFDDQGSKYDGDGNLKNWWTDEDRKAFEALTARLVEQYNAYCPLEGHCVNGALALGENIGDLGGLSIARKAYLLSAGKLPRLKQLRLDRNRLGDAGAEVLARAGSGGAAAALDKLVVGEDGFGKS